MSIALGNNQINKVYLGTTEIQKMYLGSNLVFDNTTPPDPDPDYKVSATDPDADFATIAELNAATIPVGSTIGFNRGETFRSEYLTVSGGSLGNTTTYTSYGSGNKPLIFGSLDLSLDGNWSDQGSNIWVSTGINTDVGSLIFNDDTSVGWKKWNEVDLTTQGDFWYSYSGTEVKMYSVGNPGTFYTNIEASTKSSLVGGRFADFSNTNHVTFSNLEFKYIGGPALFGATSTNFNVQDCDFSFIGGAEQNTGNEVRYGNGVVIWKNAQDIVVERCTFDQMYDAALTYQGDVDTVYTGNNVVFRNNKINRSEYSFEIFLRNASTVISNVYFENNVCTNAGGEFTHGQRSPNAAHIMIGNTSAQLSDIHIRNNIFDEATEYSIRYYEFESPAKYNVDNNCYYQSSGDVARIYGDYYDYATQWEAYQTDSGNDTNSVATNPLLDSNLQPTVELPTPRLSNVLEDFIENLRSDPTTMGAYELNVVENNLFPEAVGFGADWLFNQDYEVKVVTTLNDSGTGSLREAILSAPTKPSKIVVFNGLSGEITLGSVIEFYQRSEQIYVAGQTSENGISIKGSDYDGPLMRFTGNGTDGTILRGLTLGRGASITQDLGNGDALQVGYGSKNVIVDHCTLLWSTDETFQAYGGVTGLTVQNCIIGEGLMASSHPDYPDGHSCGAILGSVGPEIAENFTFYNNLFTQNNSRTPLVGQSYHQEYVKNIVYNVRIHQVELDENIGYFKDVNLINNVSIDGDNTYSGGVFISSVNTDDNQLYVKDNYNTYRTSPTDDDWIAVGDRAFNARTPLPTSMQALTPFDYPLKDEVTVTPAELLASQTAYGGVGTFKRNNVEDRLLNDVINQTGSIINDPSEVGGWPVISAGTIITDSNGNGIPDSEEGTWGDDTYGYINDLATQKLAGTPLGPELVTNGGFDGDGTPWTSYTASTVNTGVGRVLSADGSASSFFQDDVLEIGKVYQLVYDVVDYVEGSVAVGNDELEISGTGTNITNQITATDTRLRFTRSLTNITDLSLDNISVKEVL